jgi:hypothetical protein
MNLIIDRKIRMAIVSYGYISKNHFGSIENRQNNIEIISTYDV